MKVTMFAAWPLGPALIAIGMAGCASDTSRSTVEIYSWWVSGAEQDALEAVLQDFTNKNPTVTVVNAAAQNSLTAQHELQNRMAEGNPPDTFQVNGGAELRQYVTLASPGALEPLDFLASQWKAVMPSAVLQTVTFGPHVYAVPVDIARINTLFYNKHIFTACGLEPPATMADFVHVAQVLQANDVTPVAIGAEVPWTLEVIFKGCLAGAGGANYYTAFSSGASRYFGGGPGAPASDPTFDAAVSCFGTILGAANKNSMRQLTWDQAVKEVRTGLAAMTIMGDWALGEFVEEGATPDVDFGEVPIPDSAATFIFTTDTFVLPVGAKNRAGAVALLTEWGSTEGQGAFYPRKGTIATRTDVDASAYSSISRATMADFASEDVVVDWALALPQGFTTNFDLALDRFADDGNAENVVLAAKNNYDLVMTGHWP